MSTREGPHIEIKRGLWQERLFQIDKLSRSELEGVKTPEPPRWALVIEPGPGAGAFIAAVKPLLGDDVLAIQGKEAPLKIGAILPRLKEAHAAEPLVGICVIGTGDRDDARQAAWDLGPLAARPWVFVHALTPPSGLVPTVGEKVSHYLEIIDLAAFMEGPRPSRR